MRVNRGVRAVTYNKNARDIVAIIWRVPPNRERMHVPSLRTGRSSHITIGELARILEGKYHLTALFNDYIWEKFVFRLQYTLGSGKVEAPSKKLRRVEYWLKREWRAWILREGHGILTKVAKQYEGTSFIDTGEYYKAIQPKIIMRYQYDKYMKDLSVRGVGR